MFCKDGYYSLYALETFHLGKVIMIDSREKMIERAKTISKKLGFDQVEFRTQNINSIEISEKFDMILNIGSLRKHQDPRKIIEKTYNLTNKFAIIESAVTLKTEDGNYFESADPKRDEGSTFSDSMLENWIRKFDWEIIVHEKNKLHDGNLGGSFFLCKKRN